MRRREGKKRTAERVYNVILGISLSETRRDHGRFDFGAESEALVMSERPRTTGRWFSVIIGGQYVYMGTCV